MITASAIEKRLDQILSRFQTGPIQYFPPTAGVADRYGQRDKTFGTPVTLVGRAIHKPTGEQITAIGDGEKYDIAFLFSRKELRRKFPLSPEGEWLSNYGELTWRSRRYKIEKVAPTGQVEATFLLEVALATNLLGQRNP